MINRKIALSGLSILSALTMVAASAFAQFTAQATTIGNTFSSGTEHLQISTDGGNTYHDTLPNPFNGTKITEGYSHTFNFKLHNDNTNSSDTLNVTATFANGTPDGALDNALVTQFSCTNNSVTTTPSPFNVTAMRGGSVSLGQILSGTDADCSLTVSMPTGDSSLAGKTTSFDVDFNASQ